MAADGTSVATSFGGEPTLSQRSAGLVDCASNSSDAMCGFLAPSGFDVVREKARSASSDCRVVVLTAIFGGADRLRQPLLEPTAGTCFFAFVDQVSAGMVQGSRTINKKKDGDLPTVGAWRLLEVPEPMPFKDARRNSRVPKMLPHRFFPSASFCVWVDGKLELQPQPEAIIQSYLVDAGADIGAVRNLRRHTIDHEYAWIRSMLCPRPERPKPPESDLLACHPVERQMDVYESEQSAHPGWHLETAVIEGALVLLDLRSAATQCFLCAWFNEYVRFGERDQLSFAYVAYTQRPRLRLNLLPRRIHWSVTVEDDTMRCYNATEADAAQLAVRFQHNRPDQKTGRPVVRAAALGREAAGGRSYSSA